jgi:predicted site-specific integrase-resolvase
MMFPRTSRVTLYRWRRDGKIRAPDLVVGNRVFYREDRPLDPPPETDRRRTRKPASTTA